MGISGKGLINSMGLETIRGSKNIYKARFAITELILKDLSKIIKELKDVPYEIMLGRYPITCLLTVIFIYQDMFKSV